MSGRSSNNATNAKEEDTPCNQDIIEIDQDEKEWPNKVSEVCTDLICPVTKTMRQPGIVGVYGQLTSYLSTLLCSDQWSVNYDYDLVSESES